MAMTADELRRRIMTVANMINACDDILKSMGWWHFLVRGRVKNTRKSLIHKQTELMQLLQCSEKLQEAYEASLQEQKITKGD